MSLLIAVKSCWKDKARDCHDSIRRTWGQHAHIADANLTFFLGYGSGKTEQDEVVLNVQDDYDSLPFKTRSILEFFLDRNYDHVLLCDIDTFLIPYRIPSCGYKQFDYSGRFGSVYPVGTTFTMQDDRNHIIENCHPWASGGIGYFLSREAARIVTETEPNHWAEDLYVGQALGPYIQSGHILAADLPNFEIEVGWHFPRRMYENRMFDPSFGWMEKMYKEKS
jgi:hypothetical protein